MVSDNDIIELCSKILIGFLGCKTRKHFNYVLCKYIKITYFGNCITIKRASTYGFAPSFSIPDIAINNPAFPIDEIEEFIRKETLNILTCVKLDITAKAKRCLRELKNIKRSIEKLKPKRHVKGKNV